MARTVEFPPNGNRILASPREIVDAWRRATPRIPARFALGTAQHESDFAINEIDTEESGFVSIGIYQLSTDEAAQAGNPNASLLTLADSTSVFATLCERRLDQIIGWAALDPSALPSDVWAYLYIAHNQGTAACRKTIAAYGLDWAAYKQRNDVEHPNWVSYGDDVISGGARWTPDLDGPIGDFPTSPADPTPPNDDSGIPA